MTGDDLLLRLAREAERLEEDCLYSAKGHFEAARPWRGWNLGLGLPSVLLATLSAWSGFKAMPEVAGALALASGAVTAVLTFLKPGDRAAAHQKAGTLFNSLKSRARLFREVEIAAGSPPAASVKRLRRLTDTRNALNEASPDIPRAAFERARRGVEGGEAAYRVDHTHTPPAAS